MSESAFFFFRFVEEVIVRASLALAVAHHLRLVSFSPHVVYAIYTSSKFLV